MSLLFKETSLTNKYVAVVYREISRVDGFILTAGADKWGNINEDRSVLAIWSWTLKSLQRIYDRSLKDDTVPYR